MRLSFKRLYYWLTLALFLVLPINYMVFNILLKQVPLIKFTKDILMILLLFLALLEGMVDNRYRKNQKSRTSISFSAIVIFIIVFVRIITSTHLNDSLYAARLVVVPILFYLLYSAFAFDEEEKRNLLKIVFIFSFMISVWGIFQAYVLGDSFLIGLNYKGDTGRLSHGFYISGYRGIQRVTGTFPAPNLMAMYLNCVFFIFLNKKDEIGLEKRFYVSGMIAILLASILTFSRSGWLGLICGLLFIYRRKKAINKVKFMRMFVLILVLLISAIIVINKNENIKGAFSLLLSKTFDGTDASMISHTDSVQDTLNIIFNNVGGYNWFGYNGPRTREGVINYNVESSVLLVGLELGVIGMVSMAMYFVNMVRSAKNSKNGNAVLASIIAILPSLLFLPLLYEYELITFIYTFWAVVLNTKSTSQQA